LCSLWVTISLCFDKSFPTCYPIPHQSFSLFEPRILVFFGSLHLEAYEHLSCSPTAIVVGFSTFSLPQELMFLFFLHLFNFTNCRDSHTFILSCLLLPANHTKEHIVSQVSTEYLICSRSCPYLELSFSKTLSKLLYQIEYCNSTSHTQHKLYSQAILSAICFPHSQAGSKLALIPIDVG